MANNLPQFFSDGKRRILVLDPSAQHMAYVCIILDFDKKELIVEKVGMLWTLSSWSRGRRYRYMSLALRTMAKDFQAIVTEAFFANPRQMQGSAVVPTINAFAEMAADECKIAFYDLGATTWRSILGIKPIKDAKGKRDYKEPTANLVKQQLSIPEEIESNINRKMRTLPNDVTDVLAIALAIGRHHGINKVKQEAKAFNPISMLDMLEKLQGDL